MTTIRRIQISLDEAHRNVDAYLTREGYVQVPAKQKDATTLGVQSPPLSSADEVVLEYAPVSLLTRLLPKIAKALVEHDNQSTATTAQIEVHLRPWKSNFAEIEFRHNPSEGSSFRIGCMLILGLIGLGWAIASVMPILLGGLIVSLDQLIWENVIPAVGIPGLIGLLALLRAGADWLRVRSREQGFWRAVGWKKQRDSLVAGELTPGRTSLQSILFKALMPFAIWMFMRFLGFPDVFIVILVIGLLIDLSANLLWYGNPLLQWKASLLKEVPLTVPQLAQLAFFTHILIMFIVGAAGWLLDGAAAMSQRMNLMLLFDKILSGTTNLDLTYGPQGFMPVVYGDLQFFGLDNLAHDSTSYGNTFFSLVERLLPKELGVEMMRELALVFVGSVAAGALVNIVSLFRVLRTPKRWKRRYGLLPHSGPVPDGLRSSRPKWWEWWLFRVWMVACWGYALVITAVATGVAVGVVYWTVTGRVLLTDQLPLWPYSALESALELLGQIHWFQPLVAALLGLPVLLLLGIWLSGLFTFLARFVKWCLFAARGDHARHWRAFREKYQLPRVRLLINPSLRSRLQAYYLGWLAVVEIPQRVWKWYRASDTSPVPREQLEVLFLHECGHLAGSGLYSLLELIGCVTGMGYNYFALAIDSLKAESTADKFAAERCEAQGLDPDLIDQALLNYGRYYEGAYRLPRVRRPIWYRALRSLVKPAQDWFLFMFGTRLPSYVYPEYTLRRALRSGQPVPGTKSAWNWTSLLAPGILLLVMFTCCGPLWGYMLQNSMPASTPPPLTSEERLEVAQEPIPDEWYPGWVWDVDVWNDDLYAASEHGLYRIDLVDLSATRILYPLDFEIPNDGWTAIRCLLPTSSGLWACGTNALFQVQEQDVTAHRLRPMSILAVRQYDMWVYRLIQGEHGLIAVTSHGIIHVGDWKYWLYSDTPMVEPEDMEPIWLGLDGLIHFLMQGKEHTFDGLHSAQELDKSLDGVYDGINDNFGRLWLIGEEELQPVEKSKQESSDGLFGNKLMYITNEYSQNRVDLPPGVLGVGEIYIDSGSGQIAMAIWYKDRVAMLLADQLELVEIPSELETNATSFCIVEGDTIVIGTDQNLVWIHSIDDSQWYSVSLPH